MKFYKLGMVAVMSTLLLSACSGTGGRTGWYDQWGSCAAVGAGVGMAAGATDDFALSTASPVSRSPVRACRRIFMMFSFVVVG